MKKLIMLALVLAVSSSAFAALGDVNPTGLTGLWRFQDSANKLKATIGNDLTTSDPGNSAWFLGPWTDLGVPSWHTMYSDGGCVQERSWNYLTANPGFTANGGGSYVNEYTIVMDYVQTSGQTSWNGLYQTDLNGNGSDSELFTDGAGHIGIGAVGYSTLTYDTSKWHRIAISVDNGNFFRVYVDGVLFLDGAGQAIDGRFSAYTDTLHFFADNSWEDQWGLVGTIAVWNRALGSAEVADLGGWLNGSATPTPLIIIPEPMTLAVLALGGLLIRRK